jgi:hypothetical protein
LSSVIFSASGFTVTGTLTKAPVLSLTRRFTIVVAATAFGSTVNCVPVAPRDPGLAITPGLDDVTEYGPIPPAMKNVKSSDTFPSGFARPVTVPEVGVTVRAEATGVTVMVLLPLRPPTVAVTVMF